MPPRRKGRSTRRSIAPVARTPTPEAPSDHEMQDAPQLGTPAQEEGTGVVEPDLGSIADGDDDNDEDVATTPRDDASEASASRAGTPPPTRGRGRGRARGRRGRPRVRPLPPGRESKEGSQEASDTGTPKPRRGGWRGRGFGAGRWANRRGGAQRADQMPQDAEGNQLAVENDEAVLPEDPEGETKVDKDGNLLGGREYRVRTFTVQGKGNRLYMLSTEPARCIGFRDSYLFFQKHRVLYKIILGDDEKMDLIEREIMPHSYKGRSIGVVTARSVFREFGAKIVIGGKNVIDDYQTQRARNSGLVEGDLAVPEDRLPRSGQEYDRNRYVAWHGASSVYHTTGPAITLQPGEIKKRKIPITGVNWMYEHARAASRFNSSLTALRRANNVNGVYDIFTNHIHYPKIMQPTHARWERIPTPPPEKKPKLDTNGHAKGDDTMETTDSQDHFLPAPDPFVTRNFMVVDHVYVTPPESNLGVPGIDGGHWDVGAPGLDRVTQEMIDSLPEEDRAAFLAARQRELEWKAMWLDEETDARRPGKDGRQPLNITYYNWTQDDH